MYLTAKIMYPTAKKTSQLLRIIALLMGLGLLVQAVPTEAQVTAYKRDGGNVEFMNETGNVTDTGVSEVEYLGRLADLDDDGALEIPAVNSNGDILLIETEPAASRDTIVTGDAKTSESSLGVGDQDDDGIPEVLFQNASDNNYVYRAELDGSKVKITGTPANGVIGFGDFNDDGDVGDTVFLGPSDEIKYLDEGSVNGTGVSDVGSNNGRGVGPLADFDGSGVPRVAVVSSSNELVLVDDQGNTTEPSSGYQDAQKAPIGAADRRGNDRLEIVHRNASEGTLYTVDLDGNAEAVTDSDTNKVSIDNAVGAAGNSSTSEPLPVELARFTGSVEASGRRDVGNEAVRLRWQTVSETGNAGFEVQRKAVAAQAASWSEVGFVESKVEGGTTNEPQTYRFMDERLPYTADTLVYRLRQVDTDGSVHHSEPVRVARSDPGRLKLVGTYPNPVRKQVTVRYAIPKEGEARETALRLYDVMGRRVRSVSTTSQERGHYEQTLDVSGLASGVYVLRLEAEGIAKTRKLTVVR
jgi:hypothetical protein